MSKKEFTATEVMALIEDLRSDFRIVAEQLTTLNRRFDDLYEMVAKNAEDIEMMRLDIAIIKRDIKAMKAQLPVKADKKDLTMLEKRVYALEQRLHH